MVPRLLILDRDGVINEDSQDFIKRPDEWVPLPGSLRALGTATQAGFRISIVSNQSGLARGLLQVEDLHRIHARLLHAAEHHGGVIDAFFFCPHGPEDRCDCRKPLPGLLQAAAARSGLALEDAVMIGDRESDIAAARAAGVLPILVRTGHGEQAAEGLRGVPDLCIYPDLAYAVNALCARIC
jgi:D-glycero-D-manno-heptose 1,7-bisphosphate phosphatase